MPLCAIPAAGTALIFLLLGTFVVLLRRKNAAGGKRGRELKALAANIPGCVQHCKYDSFLTIVYCSDGLPRLTGYTPEEIGRFFHNRLLLMIYEPDREGIRRSIDAQLRDGSVFDVQYRLLRKDGTLIWILDKGRLTAESGKESGLYCLLTDITGQREIMRELVQKAQRDGLTGLLNKSATKSYIEQALTGSGFCALYLIDVDHFKDINDHLGHMFGDSVLAEIGGRLKKLFRASDVVGRVGGDEFMVLLKSIGDLSLVAEKADAIRRSLQQTFENGPEPYSVSGSIGIAVYPKDGRTYADLYKRADAALYEAKRRGRSRFVIFDGGLEASGHRNGAPERSDSLPLR
ncbi:GGDEF domain-containing protein [Caproiciproducens sp.]